jgi:DHA3 family tetracycline resistance protein-like MFS transporter
LKIKKAQAYKVYLFMEAGGSLLFALAFAVVSLYEATVAKLTPFQLVMVGTTVEISAFLFEIPTGVVADAYSRRLSIILGWFLLGLSFLVEGLFPFFGMILLAQVISGLGYTFTSGATQAWITDEIGEERANQAFLRANSLGLAFALAGMLAAVLVGASRVNLPILVSGISLLAMALVLVLIMPETGFHPTPRQDRNNWAHMAKIFRDGLAAVRARPRLINILAIGLIYGLYSEGFDRLWVKHLITGFHVPVLFGQNQVTFFGFLRAGGMLASILATRFIEKRLDTSRPAQIGRAMLLVTALIAAGLIAFANAPILAIAIGVYCLISMGRNVAGPLYNAWVNQKLDSATRATVLSMSSQMDAFGQIGGGPLAASIAALVSVPAAISTSGLLLTPALGLIGRANRQTAEHEASLSEESAPAD